MSHWTKIHSKISDLEALKKGLARMGIEVTEGNFNIKQYEGSEKAELKVDNAVGFSRQEDGTFAMVGDFYHSNDPKLSKYYGNTQNFSKDLENAYAIEETILKMEEQQFYCAENSEGQVGQDSIVRMVFERN